MCNLYRLTKTTAEVANWFSAIEQLAGANFAGEVFPGTPGMVVTEGALVSMSWGFPLQRTGSKGQALKPKPVNNTRADKLDGFFWRYSFAERRCLIPLNAWAEAEGPRGGKTRSWLSLPDAPLFACAGIWRDSDEWGRCYSMVMTDACGVAADCHDRMPVILSASDYAIWTAGEPEAARALCRPWEGPLTLERTDEPWAGGAAQPPLL
ncbi:SOS response-associated peptidase [Erythrobacter sp. LQ02-29]|uniref:SOS response-associated peptidase n=1 Tax=Erythrobacter sp. LQ02-29 TaxID=2920384 RepID=UPI001F4F06EB|nr:SOS response-associated peptidase family protein [Erythrobacter sp. LQ02-29]MCP9222847.1 SOS response-associated peptidase [Erythrobacter sp. LQ02-29]